MIVYPGRAQWLPHTKCQDLTSPRWSKGEGESKIFRKHCHLTNLNILGRKGSLKKNLLVILALFVCFAYHNLPFLPRCRDIPWGGNDCIIRIYLSLGLAHLLLSLFCKRYGLHTRLILLFQRTCCPSLLSCFITFPNPSVQMSADKKQLPEIYSKKDACWFWRPIIWSLNNF